MPDSEIQIFYSWQSDLPANTTRNLILDSIKDAVKLLRDTVSIEADRDTQGQSGSPDISQTILAKIEKCDIFIADVTPVCTYKKTDKDGRTKNKLMPNPNVMLELGYASHVVGWNNVICIMNGEYGNVDDMPFDIRNHRLMVYNINEQSSKADVRRSIRDVIQMSVIKLLEEGRRPKAGFSHITVGGFENGKITAVLSPFQLTNSDSFIQYRMNLINDAQELFDEISSISISSPSSVLLEESSPTVSPGKKMLFDLSKPYTVNFSADKKSSMEEYCQKYLNKSLSEVPDFWNIGNLKAKTILGLNNNIEYDGTEAEKDKHDKIEALYSLFCHVSLLEEYVKTFDGMLFLRFAVENLSTTYDEDITIHIEIHSSKAYIISPSKELIVLSLKDIAGFIVDEDYIRSLLFLDETSEIRYDDDYLRSIEATEYTHYMFDAAGINGNPKFNADDYEIELSKYIASPCNQTSYEFNIGSLKAKERKWLGRVILIKSISDSLELKYTIKSKHSDGSLSGILKVSL